VDRGHAIELFDAGDIAANRKGFKMLFEGGDDGVITLREGGTAQST
jgi:hypothetical protein